MSSELSKLMQAGDTIIDGGNSFYKDDVRRAESLKDKGVTLPRCGHERRDLGRRPRILPDDRRRRGCVQTGRADICHAGSRDGGCPAHTRSRTEPGNRRKRVICIAARPARATSSKWFINGIEYGLMQAYAERVRHPARCEQQGAQGRVELMTSIFRRSRSYGGGGSVVVVVAA